MNESVNPVETVNDSGTAAAARIVNAASAHAVYKGMEKSDESRAIDRAKIKGMCDGQRPYSEKELRAKGMAWRSNVNFREAEGIMDATTGSYTELILELSELVDVDVLPESEIDDPDGNFGEIIAEEYTRILTKWPKFIPTYSVMVGQFCRYGRGHYFWSDPYSWKYKAVRAGNFMTREGEGVTLEDFTIAIVRDSLTPGQLYKYAETAEATKMGWNREAIKRLLVKNYNKGMTRAGEINRLISEYESMRQRIASKDLGLDDPAFQPVQIAYILEKSVATGKIRMSIIETEDTPDGYLFDRQDVYDSFYQATAMFMYNYAEGDFHDVKGLGHKSYAHVDISNRMMNGAIDGSIIMNSLLVTGNTNSVNDVLRIARLGPITVIPDSLQVVQQSFQPRLDATLGVRSVLAASLNNNTGVNKSQPESTGPVERTAAGVKYRAGKESGFNRNQVLIFASQWDRFHYELFRRLLNPDYPAKWDGKEEAELFKRRCIERGVPPQLLRIENFGITSRRSIGNGSSMDRDTSTKEMVALAPSMNERGAKAALRDRGAYLVGYANIDRYFPKNGNDAPTNDDSIAQLENNDLMEGSVVLVGNDQNHGKHLDIHLRKLIEIAEQYQQAPEQVDIVALARYFIAAMEHAIEHIAVLQNNPIFKNDAEVYMQTIKSLIPVREEIRRAAEKLIGEQQQAAQQMQQESQGEQDPELRMKLERHAVDMQIKMAQATSSMQLKKEMQDSTIRMREIKEAHRMAIQRNRG